jgi:hypothetical protein
MRLRRDIRARSSGIESHVLIDLHGVKSSCPLLLHLPGSDIVVALVILLESITGCRQAEIFICISSEFLHRSVRMTDL